jgi:hypothetical protein
LSGQAILSTAYGVDVQPENDPFIGIAERSVQIFTETGQASAYLVDSLPWLKYVPKWFPGARFKRDAEEYCKVSRDNRDVPFLHVKRALVSLLFFYSIRFKVS